MLCKIMAKGLIFRVRQGILIVPFRWLSLLHLTWRAVLDIGVRVRFLLLLLRTSRYVCQPPRALREDGGRGAFEREASSTREIHFKSFWITSVASAWGFKRKVSRIRLFVCVLRGSLTALACSKGR